MTNGPISFSNRSNCSNRLNRSSTLRNRNSRSNQHRRSIQSTPFCREARAPLEDRSAEVLRTRCRSAVAAAAVLEGADPEERRNAVALKGPS